MKSCFLLLVVSAILTAQNQEGNVVDALTGAPIEGAYITAQATNGSSIFTRTDRSGRFHLGGASLTLSAAVHRAGYLSQRHSLQPGQDASGIRVKLTPEAVIAGTLQDEDGFPVANAHIRALWYRLVNGERQLQSPALTQSDDLGQFRLAGLSAGRYRIGVATNDLRIWDDRYVTQFFPGGLQPGDTDVFEVKAGQELGGVGLRLAKYDGVTVTGRVLSANEAPVIGRTSVSLQSGVLISSNTAWPQRDGTFSIRRVPPGDYVLHARTGGSPKAGDLMAQQQLQVGDSDVSGLVLTLHEVQPVDLPGTIVVDGGGKPPRMVINLQGDSQSITAHSEEDGSFVLKGLMPGHYRNLQVQREIRFVNGAACPASPDWAGVAVSALLGEKEILHDGFDLDGPPPGPLRITLGSWSVSTSGTLLDATGQLAAGAQLVLISSSRPATEIGANTDAKGAFKIVSPVAGEFRVFVVPDLGQADLFHDPDFIEAHQADYPPVRLVNGQNPPILLRMPAKQ